MGSGGTRSGLGWGEWSLAIALVLLCVGAVVATRAGDEPAVATNPEVDPRGVPLTAQEARGRAIYHFGTSTQGPITALQGDGAVRVPATVLPCANCHGRSGLGKPEGGVVPPPVTWEALSKPFVAPVGPRARAAYDEAALVRSLRTGEVPGGRRLDATTMPRYEMSPADAAALVAYLKRLGREPVPGVGHDEVRLGVLLPPAQKAGGVATAVRAALNAFVREQNARGGVHGRRLALRFLSLPAQEDAREAAVRGFVRRDDVFALVASFLVGVEGSVPDLLHTERVPLVGAITFDPRPGTPPKRYVFYLYAGLRDQCRALVRAAKKRRDGDASAIVLHTDDLESVRVAETMARAWAHGEPTRPRLVALPPAAHIGEDFVRGLAADAATTLFFLGKAAQLQALLRASATTSWTPRVFAPGAVTGPELYGIAPAFQDRVFLAFPQIPDDLTPAGRHAYEALNLPREHTAMQWAALAGARLAVHGMATMGRHGGREDFVDALERVQRFATGFTPPVTYSLNRRIGARGAHIVRVDLTARKLVPEGWVDVGAR